MKCIFVFAVTFIFYLQTEKVYICKSGTSYAYHNSYCQGLRQCTHKIDTVTITQAIESGHKKPCGYCYR